MGSIEDNRHHHQQQHRVLMKGEVVYYGAVQVDNTNKTRRKEQHTNSTNIATTTACTETSNTTSTSTTTTRRKKIMPHLTTMATGVRMKAELTTKELKLIPSTGGGSSSSSSSEIITIAAIDMLGAEREHELLVQQHKRELVQQQKKGKAFKKRNRKCDDDRIGDEDTEDEDEEDDESLEVLYGGCSSFRLFECRLQHQNNHGQQQQRFIFDHTFRVVEEEEMKKDDNNNKQNHNHKLMNKDNHDACRWVKILKNVPSLSTLPSQPSSTTMQTPMSEMTLSQIQEVMELERQLIGVRRPKRRFMVLINPMGGTKKAVKIFNDKVAPVFDRCDDIEYNVTVTERQHHATDIISSNIFLKAYHCIVVVGGDGFVSEVIQGLMSRNDWTDSIQIPLGIVPGGTGNGLANSLVYTNKTEACDPINAAYAIAKGTPKGLDIASIRCSNDQFYSFLSLEWAFVANIDLESERFRCLGEARYTISAIKRILCSQQKWYGQFSYLPSNNDNSNDHDDYHQKQSKKSLIQQRQPVDDLLPPLNVRTVPNTWKTIEGEFGFFWAISASHASNDTIVYPDAKYDDGYMYCVFTTDGLSTMEKIKALLSMEDGSYLSNPKFQIVRTKAFQLEPYDDNIGQHCGGEGNDLMAVDGELWGTASTQVQVHRKLAKVITL